MITQKGNRGLHRGLHRGLQSFYTTYCVKIKLMNRDILCHDAEISLSRERLLSYKRKEDQDDFNVVSRHLWNTALCEALYPTLQCFEIVLRNAIHGSLSDYYRPDWLQDNNFLRSYERDSVTKAEDDLFHQNKSVAPGRVVAELVLGGFIGAAQRHCRLHWLHKFYSTNPERFA